MKLTVLGCSGGIGGVQARTTSFLVDDDVLIDCGTGVGDLPLDALLKIDHVFLTHAHLDHIASLPLLIDAVCNLRTVPLTVHATPETIRILHSHVFNWLVWPDFSSIPDRHHPFMRFQPMKVNETTCLGTRSITALPAQHTVPSVAYCLDSGEGKLVFSGDTAYCAELIAAINALPDLRHLVYASSSSVYGSNTKVPYSTDDKVDNPVSLYAATKKSDELMAHAYSKLYDIPSTGLRFFTVYGPAGRPDMAYFGFTDKLVKGDTIRIFNYGNCQRDFTYIDDIVEGIVRIMQRPPQRTTGADGLPQAPYRLYNIGNNHPENLLTFVDILQQELIRAGVLPSDYDFAAHQQLVPMQPGDVPVTYADTSVLERDFGYKPATPLRTGLRAFAEWYAQYQEPPLAPPVGGE